MKHPIQLAGAVVLNERHEVLLIHRILGRTEWEVPGGKLQTDSKTGEPTEEPQHAAIREFKEELGCEISIIRQLEESDFGGNEGTFFHYTWFLAAIKSGKPVPQEIDRHDNVGYIDIVHPPDNIVLSSGTQKLRELVLNGSVSLG